MKPLFLIAISFNGLVLLYAIWSYVRHRRTGTPLPVYQKGGISGTLGMMLMLASLISGIDEQLVKWLVGAGFALAAWSVTLVFRTTRAEQSRVRQ